MSATTRRQRKKREALRYLARETEAHLVGPVVGMKVRFTDSSPAWQAIGEVTEVSDRVYFVSWDARAPEVYGVSTFGPDKLIWLLKPRSGKPR